MNMPLLKKHIAAYKKHIHEDHEKHVQDLSERKQRTDYYQAWTKDRLLKMTEEEFYEYVSKLWAMLIWGNKRYVVNKLIQDNGFDKVKSNIADLVWSMDSIEKRWDTFRKGIKGFGPAMMSEILCHVHPADFIIWNRRAYVGLDYLGIKNLPRHYYQLTGEKYFELCRAEKEILAELLKAGINDANLLTVDYFIWDELQVEDNLSRIYAKKGPVEVPPIQEVDTETLGFIHDEIRDKLADIGTWLGFKSQMEVKIAEGSKVDTIWEATIGNMGRVIYVFEVQTKGSIGSLILNLLKALNNPAVQGIVAVSDADQLDKIQKHATPVVDLSKKLKYWDYKKVLEIHEALEMVNESINSLGLVPQGF
jgi:hypothetical protein